MHGSWAYREAPPVEDEAPPSSCRNKRVLAALSRLSALRGNARGSEELAARAAWVAEGERSTRRRKEPADPRAAELREAAYLSYEVRAFAESVRRFEALEALEPLGAVDHAVLSCALRAVGRRGEATALRRALLAMPFSSTSARFPPAVALELGTLLLDLGDRRAHAVLEGVAHEVTGSRRLLSLDVLLAAADAALAAGAPDAAAAHTRAARGLAAALDPSGGLFGRVLARQAALLHHEGRLVDAESTFAEALRRGHRADLALTDLLLAQRRFGEADLLAGEHIRCLRALGFAESPPLCPALRMRARTLVALGRQDQAACLVREHDGIVRGVLGDGPVSSSGR